MRDKGRSKMEVLPDFEKRNTILKDFNKLVDERDAAWVANEDSDYSKELDSRAEKAMEKLSALIREARKTDPELAERLYRRKQERFRLRPRGEKARREQQAWIEQQGCKCAGCGGPLDINQQMMFTPPNILCDFCCEEMIVDTEKYGKEMTEEEITAAVERERERVA
jgi:hypothetical protein